MRVFRAVLYGFTALVLGTGWAFLYWQSGTVDLAAGNEARGALEELRAIDARWNDQLVGARLQSAAGQRWTPATWGNAYARLEVRALGLAYPGLGRSLAGVKAAFDEKAALLARVAAGETALVDAAWLVSTGPRLDQFSRVLERAYDEALTQAELYRAWLLYYSGLLLTLLLYLAYELYRANRGLEQRVAERTRELAAALDRLKESEALLVQSEKMSSLGQMVAGLAHEVNTPLAYVKASLEAVRARAGDSARLAAETGKLLALLQADDADEAALAAQFERVRGLAGSPGAAELEAQVKDGLYGITQISELVANLKDFSRLDRGKVAQYDLRQGIDATLRIAARTLGKRSVKKVYGEIPPVSCAPSQVNQVLLNLLVNAAHATPEAGGAIVVRTGMRGEGHVAVEVADNGHGIPEEVLPKIFDPFFTTKEAGKGTGLGLSICYRIVEGHGGKLEVQSRVGVGTRFTVVLPVQAAAA